MLLEKKISRYLPEQRPLERIILKKKSKIEFEIKTKKLEISLILRKAKKQGQAKATSSGQQDTILKWQLLRLLKSGIKDLIQWKNWSVVSAEYQSKKMS